MKLKKPLLNYILWISFFLLVVLGFQGLFSQGDAFVLSNYTFIACVFQLLGLTITIGLAIKITEVED